MEGLVSSGQLQKLIIGIKDAGDLEKRAIWLRKKLTEQTIRNASYSLDAASLVFGHTILDDSLNSFLEITCEVAPEFWESRVQRKKVEVGLLKGRSPEELTKDVIRKDIEDIRLNASLAGRAGMLHAICKPASTSLGSYQFDPEVLREIDTIRKNIVHGDLLGAEIPEIHSSLEYLRVTWNFCFLMMHQRFGLHIDPEAIPQGANDTPQQGSAEPS